jgi:hypothetical protein
VILTKEFLQQFDGCTEGYRYCLQNNLIPSDYDEAIKFMRENDKEEYAIWLEQQKTSEAFVRMNGSIFTMGAYQVFNPLTGQHVRAETEEEAKTVFLEIVRQLTDFYAPTIVQELQNENGDTAWVATDMKQVLKDKLTLDNANAG